MQSMNLKDDDSSESEDIDVKHLTPVKQLESKSSTRTKTKNGTIRQSIYAGKKHKLSINRSVPRAARARFRSPKAKRLRKEKQTKIIPKIGKLQGFVPYSVENCFDIECVYNTSTKYNNLPIIYTSDVCGSLINGYLRKYYYGSIDKYNNICTNFMCNIVSQYFGGDSFLFNCKSVDPNAKCLGDFESDIIYIDLLGLSTISSHYNTNGTNTIGNEKETQTPIIRVSLTLKESNCKAYNRFKRGDSSHYFQIEYGLYGCNIDVDSDDSDDDDDDIDEDVDNLNVPIMKWYDYYNTKSCFHKIRLTRFRLGLGCDVYEKLPNQQYNSLYSTNCHNYDIGKPMVNWNDTLHMDIDFYNRKLYFYHNDIKYDDIAMDVCDNKRYIPHFIIDRCNCENVKHGRYYQLKVNQL